MTPWHPNNRHFRHKNLDISTFWMLVIQNQGLDPSAESRGTKLEILTSLSILAPFPPDHLSRIILMGHQTEDRAYPG